MKHSEQLNEFAKAMSGLQSEIKDAEKDTQAYNYKYADLYQVLSLIRPLLAKHGLCFTQHVSNADDKVIIETMLIHSSGQWISSEIAMPPTPNSKMSAAQAVGSAITYGRRYALTAIFGITQTSEDVDGTAEKPQAARPKPEPTPSRLITKEQEFELSKLMFETKSDSAKFLEAYSVKSYQELNQDQYRDAIAKLKKKVAAKAPTAEQYAGTP